MPEEGKEEERGRGGAGGMLPPRGSRSGGAVGRGVGWQCGRCCLGGWYAGGRSAGAVAPPFLSGGRVREQVGERGGTGALPPSASALGWWGVDGEKRRGDDPLLAGGSSPAPPGAPFAVSRHCERVGGVGAGLPGRMFAVRHMCGGWARGARWEFAAAAAADGDMPVRGARARL